MSEKSLLGPNKAGLQDYVKIYASFVIQHHTHFEYHNLEHTRWVVKWTSRLGGREKIPKKKLELLIIAAWFHDTGFAINPDGHEEFSAKIMEEFLTAHLQTEQIKFIRKCILATARSTKPENIYEYIIRDADLGHLGWPDYMEWNQRLRLEWERVYKRQYNDEEWHKLNLDFLQVHEYHTESARFFLNPNKLRNMAELQSQLISADHSIVS